MFRVMTAASLSPIRVPRDERSIVHASFGDRLKTGRHMKKLQRKKDQRVQKKSLRLHSETIREMSLPQLAEVGGGSLTTPTNAGCGSSTANAHTCHICVF